MAVWVLGFTSLLQLYIAMWQNMFLSACLSPLQESSTLLSQTLNIKIYAVYVQAFSLLLGSKNAIIKENISWFLLLFLIDMLKPV